MTVCDAWCARIVTLGTLHCITFLALVVVLGRILLFERRLNYRFFIFALAALQALLGWIHYFGAHGVVFLAYIMYLVSMLMYTLICYYFCSLALYLFQREEMVKRLLNPIFVVIAVYFFTVTIVGGVRIGDGGVLTVCKDAYWLLLSVSGCILSFVFLASALLITKKLSRYVVISRSLREERSQVLRVLLIVNFVSCLFGLSYDLAMELDVAVNQESRCNDWTPSPGWNAVIYIVFRSTIQLLPTWAAMWVLFVKPLMSKRSGGFRGTAPAAPIPGTLASPGLRVTAPDDVHVSAAAIADGGTGGYSRIVDGGV